MRLSIHRGALQITFLIGCATLLCLCSSSAETCSAVPKPPLTKFDEAPAKSYQDALLYAAGCIHPGELSCVSETTALKSLEAQALTAAGHDSLCAASGTTGSSPLSDDDKQWYFQRSLFWTSLFQSLQMNASAVADGTYKISTETRAAYLGVPQQPKPPELTSPIASGATSLAVQVDSTDLGSPAQSKLFVCVWSAQPTATDSLDCIARKATVAQLADKSKTGADGGNDYLLVAKSGLYNPQLKTALSTGQYISIAQYTTTAAGNVLPVASKSAIRVSVTSQCNHNPVVTPYSDCDMGFSLIGGVEQSAQSSLPTATTPFLRVFTRAGAGCLPWDKQNCNTDDKKINVWAYVRLLGAPQASSTNGVVSAVTDPSGNITTQTLSGVGTSIDYMLGLEYVVHYMRSQAYSVSVIAGFGGTTPLPANTLTQAFEAPPFGTIECSTLLSRFQPQFASDNVIAGTTTNAKSPSCLVNANSITSSSTSGTTTYAGINTLGFSNQDRSSFLGKASIGLRTIDRFRGKDNVACGDADTASQIGPCERGIVDFTVGQDATVTKGQMRNYVFKVDAVHPLPVQSVSFLYLFGSVSLRLKKNQNYPPLILQSGDLSSLTGNGSNAVPNAGVIVLPLTQPERDFYRFGVGVNASTIFSKLFAASGKS